MSTWSVYVLTIMGISLILLAISILVAIYLFFPQSKRSKQIQLLCTKFPGPYPYPIFGSGLPVMFLPKEDWMGFILAKMRKYNPVMTWWLGPYVFLTLSKPEYIEVVLRSTKIIEKSFIYNFVTDWLGNGLLTSKGADWHKQRKIITPTFHFDILETFLSVFNEKGEILVKKLQREANDKVTDVSPYLQRCALDIICETAMGTPINAQGDKAPEYVHATYKISDIITQRMSNPLVHLDFIFKLTPMGRAHDKALRVLQDFVNKVIEERKEKILRERNTGTQDNAEAGKKKRLAFLDMLLEASEAGDKLSDEQIKDQVHTLMFEGHDTVATAMSWLLFELGHHPEIQEKVFQETENIFQGSDRIPTLQDLQEMVYMDQVIKESLRLHPSVYYIGRTARHDFELDGYIVPAGTNVDFSIVHIHRNPEQFPNPDMFDPDNFLPENTIKRHPYAYIPFSAGPRNCVGQRFALLEEKVILSLLVRNFRFKSLQKREDIKAFMDLVHRPVGGIKLHITPRKE